MSRLIAIDLAVLPPPDVVTRAMEYSRGILPEGSHLRLDADHLPHVTLTQQFVREEELLPALDRVDEQLAAQRPLRVTISGAGRSGHTVWLVIERTPDLLDVHERLMETLRGFERADGGPGAFYEGEGRISDVLWVSGFRLKSSFGAFTPHITLGHGTQAPTVEPFAFDATTIAACHLGRFCTCRRVLRSWTLPAGRAGETST